MNTDAEVMTKKNDSDAYKTDLDIEMESLSKEKTSRPYIFYCVMTLSVMLLALAFAASELFSMFFSEGYLGGTFMSKLFGADGTSDMSLSEIMLNQSFRNRSYWGEKVNGANDEASDGAEGENDNFTEENKAPNPQEPPESPDSDLEDEKTEAPSGDGIYEDGGGEIPEGMLYILPMDLSLSEYGFDYIYNQSTFYSELQELGSFNVSTDLSSVYPADSPIVLIIHTHGTEAFTEEGINYYDPTSEIARSFDKSENVVSLGKAMSEVLNESGIPTLHCDIMHDAEGYTGSYARSSETIKTYLREYPSIQYVIDVHRDAVIRSGGELVKPVTKVDGEAASQIMCVVGTGAVSEPCLNWKRNLALAQRLREKLNLKYESFCRPTCLRDSSYNQQYSAYSVLLEIGAAGNTHKEALAAAKTSAKALAEVIKG